MPGTKIIHAQNYGMSLWGKTAKVIIGLPSGEEKIYFLKVELSCKNELLKWLTPDF